MQNNNPHHKLMWEINITPLTDVFLVLLIIFMAISPMLLSSQIDVNLPKAEVATAKEQEGIIITITKDNKIYLQERLIKDYKELNTLLKSELDKSKAKIVILRGDEQVVLKEVVNVMDVAISSGAQKLALACKVLEEEKKEENNEKNNGEEKTCTYKTKPYRAD